MKFVARREKSILPFTFNFIFFLSHNFLFFISLPVNFLKNLQPYRNTKHLSFIYHFDSSTDLKGI